MTDLAERLAAEIWQSQVRYGWATTLHEGAERMERTGGKDVWLANTACLIRTELERERKLIEAAGVRPGRG